MDSKSYNTIHDLALGLDAFLAQSARQTEEIASLRKTVTQRGVALQMIAEGHAAPRIVANAGLDDSDELNALYKKHLGR